jgi:hypothetical protein
VVRVDSDQFLQGHEHLFGDQVRLSKAAAPMDEPVTDCYKIARRVMLANPAGQCVECSQMIDGANLAVEQDLSLGIGHSEVPARQAQPGRAAAKNQRLAILNAIQRDLEAGRAAIDGQD